MHQPIYKAIIVDDEPNALVVMQVLLAKHCPNVQVLAATESSITAIELIKELRPHIVFLDIEMPQLNGFQLLEKVSDENFHLVFTTAYDQYAVKAFRYSAVDYLLKPIVVEDLIRSVAKIDAHDATQRQRVAALAANMQKAEKKLPPDIIALPHARGYIFQPVQEILYCEASNTYTTFYFDNKPSVLICKPLGEVEKLLDGNVFFRIHRQYLVNIKKIKELIRSDGGSVILNNGLELPLSRNRKEDLMLFMGL
jgi:two-component system LytT family response regulator